MNEQEFKQKLNRYNRNTILLFIAQRLDDKKIRSEICSKCSEEKKIKRGCINHSGKTFCQLLVKKRKENKKLEYAWKFNLLEYSPYISQSNLLSKITNSFDIVA